MIDHTAGCRAGSRGWWAALASFLMLHVCAPALAAEPDLALAERLVAEKRYQEADDLLAPFAQTQGQSPSFTYLGKLCTSDRHAV
jgi:hypothetical protein